MAAAAASAADTLFAQARRATTPWTYLDAARLAHAGLPRGAGRGQERRGDVQAYKWYQNLNGLSVGQGKAAYSRSFLPQKGAVVFPEENTFQRSKRLGP